MDFKKFKKFNKLKQSECSNVSESFKYILLLLGEPGEIIVFYRPGPATPSAMSILSKRAI
jgi:hypothetical protein